MRAASCRDPPCAARISRIFRAARVTEVSSSRLRVGAGNTPLQVIGSVRPSGLVLEVAEAAEGHSESTPASKASEIFW